MAVDRRGDRHQPGRRSCAGPKVAESPVEVCTEEDFRRLLAVCPRAEPIGRRDAAIISLLWCTGMSRGELTVLDVAHLDLDAGVLTIPKTKNGTPRRCRLLPETIGLLDRWLRRARVTRPGPLFPNEHGRRLTSNGIGQMLAASLRGGGRVGQRAQLPAGPGDEMAACWRDRDGPAGDGRMESRIRWSSATSRMSAEELAHSEFERLFA